jgi:hypothetical protein
MNVTDLFRATFHHFKLAVSWWRCHWWDWRHRVTTCGDVGRELLQIDSLCRHYVPTHHLTIAAVLKALPYYEGLDFVDWGSGKGRVILMASEYPFRSVTGIEVDPNLHRQAVENIRRYRGKCRSVARSLCIDARSYRPESSGAVHFFFAPFNQPLMEEILGGLFADLRKHPREFFVIFTSPEMKDIVDRTGLFFRWNEGPYWTIWRSHERRSRLPLEDAVGQSTTPPGR